MRFCKISDIADALCAVKNGASEFTCDGGMEIIVQMKLPADAGNSFACNDYLQFPQVSRGALHVAAFI